MASFDWIYTVGKTGKFKTNSSYVFSMICILPISNTSGKQMSAPSQAITIASDFHVFSSQIQILTQPTLFHQPITEVYIILVNQAQMR